MSADRVTLRRPCEHGLFYAHDTQHCWERERNEGVHERDDRCWCPGSTDIAFEQVWRCLVAQDWEDDECFAPGDRNHDGRVSRSKRHAKCGPRLMQVTE